MCASSSPSPSSSPSLYSLPSSPSPTLFDLMLDRRNATRDSGLKTRLTGTQRFYLPSGYCLSSHFPVEFVQVWSIELDCITPCRGNSHVLAHWLLFLFTWTVVFCNSWVFDDNLHNLLFLQSNS
ncbi:hypothetical protein ACFX1W_037673 [Malus domestica]